MASMATAFYLLSLLLYIKGRLRKVEEGRWFLWCGSIFAAILAMSSKQMAATLFVTIMLYEWYFFRDMCNTWAAQKAKHLAWISVLFVIVSLMFLGSSPLQRILAPYSQRDFTMLERVLTQFRVVVEYFSLIILPLPSRLNLLHNVEVSRSLFPANNNFVFDDFAYCDRLICFIYSSKESLGVVWPAMDIY